jgi:hypothetical protein
MRSGNANRLFGHYANNDVFTLPIRRVLAADARHLQPTRLTPDLSQTTAVQAHATSSHVYVFWGGWPKIDRGTPRARRAVTIQFAVLPLD